MSCGKLSGCLDIIGDLEGVSLGEDGLNKDIEAGTATQKQSGHWGLRWLEAVETTRSHSFDANEAASHLRK